MSQQFNLDGSTNEEPIVANSNDIVVSFVNAKLLENHEFEIPAEANVYIVSADNEIGKTTTITGLETLVSVFNGTPNLITNGKKNAVIEGNIPKADGTGNIRIKFEIEPGKSKFIAYDGKRKLSKVSEIRDLVGTYAKMSVSEILSNLKKAEGRKQVIKTLIEPILSEEEKATLEKLKADYQGNFALRTDENKLLDKAVMLVAENQLTISEKDLLSKEELAEKTLKELRNALQEKQTEKQTLVSSIDQDIENSKLKLDAAVTEVNNLSIRRNEIDAQKETVKKNVTRIEELKAELERLEVQNRELNGLIITNEGTLEEDTKIKNEAKDAAQKAYNEALLKKDSIHEKSEQLDKDIAEASDRIANGETFKSNIEKAKLKKENFDRYNADLTKHQKKVEEYTNTLNEIKEKIKKVYSGSNLPKGLTIEDDVFYYNDFVFDENQVSESAMAIILTELLCNINTSFMVNAGNYGIYGKQRFEKLVELAKRYNKHIFVEAVQYGQTEVKIVGAVVNDAPESEVKSLF